MHVHCDLTCIRSQDFQSALKLFNEKVLRPRDPHHVTPSGRPVAPTHPSSKGSSSSEKIDKDRKHIAPASVKSDNNTSTSSSVPAASAVRSVHLPPIIIVPSAVTSCITGLNARDFLIDGVYVPVEGKRLSGAKREKEQTVERPSEQGAPQHYKIIDDPLKLTGSEWDRVVAVFATGQLWQFKGWRYSSPVELFHHVLGVHVTMDDRAINTAVQSWNCKVLKVNEFKQHLNAGAAKEFWVYLDDFVRLKKPHLRSQHAAVTR